MRILIVDDSAVWLKQGRTLLERAGHEVEEYLIADPRQYTSGTLSDRAMADALKEAAVLLIDKDLGRGITSTPLICVVRHNFPKLPIIRWTGGCETTRYMEYLDVTCISKPCKKGEAWFVKSFIEALDKQKLILSGPMGIFAVLDETVRPDLLPEEFRAEAKIKAIRVIAEVAQLAERDSVRRTDSCNGRLYVWEITGDMAGPTKHDFGHTICDGILTADDIRPYLAALQKVIAKFEAAGEIDERFRFCAEFIKAGNLDDLELMQGSY